MNKQKILVSLTSVVLAGTTLLTVSQVFAQTPENSPHLNFFQELVQYISQKFGLDKTQVQSAITDFKQKND